MFRAAVLLAVAALLGGCASSHSERHRDQVVQVSVSSCGAGWTGGPAGRQHLVLRNTDSRPGSVDLVGVTGGAVYAEIEPLAAGTEDTVDADLGAGRYALRCYMEDEPAVTGPPVILTGHRRGTTPAVRPVSQADLIPATKAYEKYVTGRLPHLLALARRLRTDVTSGDLAAARRDWAPAHLAYLALGAAYGAFGTLDAAIDGRADGRPAGVHDPSWQGLHRIEYGLWHAEPAASLAPVTARLVSAVRQLQAQFPSTQLDPGEIAIRAHEITEDAIEFALTGRDDYGSHSALATVRADLDATSTVLALVRSLLAPRYPALPALDAQLRRAAADVVATRTGRGYPALDRLPRAARERIDADLGALAETLAPVAAILEPRRTS